jgi:hypothetical protein
MQIKTPTSIKQTVNPTVIIPLVSQKQTKFINLQDNNCKSKHMRNQDIVKKAMETAITIAAISTPYIVEHPIYIPWSYNNAINDPIYGPNGMRLLEPKLY